MNTKDVRLILKQPDGLYALFDFSNQLFILRDMSSAEEIRDYLVNQQKRAIDIDVLDFFRKRADDIDGNCDPFFDTAMELLDENS